MALRRGFGDSGTIAGGGGLDSGPKTFYVRQGDETTVVLLDDQPVEVVRHQMFIKGDRKANGLRQTCAGMDPVGNPDACPRDCLVCNASLRYDRIARKHMLYLTIIDEREFTIEGKTYKDMKRLLELTPESGDLFKRRRKANGSLVGARFKVYRSKSQRSARHGDDWNFLGFVYNRDAGEDPRLGLKRHFWQSQAVLNKRKYVAEKEGKQISHEEAVEDLIKPYPYEELMGSYKPTDAQAFVAYYEGAMGIVASGGAAPTQTAAASGAAGFDAPPPMPGHLGGSGGAPNYNTAPPMPASSAPAAPAQGQTQQPAAPPQPAAQPTQPAAPAQPDYSTPPWDPAQGQTQQPAAPAQPPQPAQAPAVPDPASAGGAGFTAPPFPGAVQPPSQQGQPAQAQPPAQPQAPGAQYDFGQGQGQQPAQPPAQPPQQPMADPFPTS